jgi:hypothetical protein
MAAPLDHSWHDVDRERTGLVRPFQRGDRPPIVSDLRYSLHSALKEFFEPLRTNDPRTDFYAVYERSPQNSTEIM